MSAPVLSVVLVSHNEGRHLQSTLDNLLETSPPDTEAIVVDDLSTDGSADFLARGYGATRLLRPPHRLGAPAARNYGAAAARGDVIVFSDAHVQARPGWFEDLRAVLEQPEVGMVGPVVSSLQNRDVRGYGRSWMDATLAWKWLTKQADVPYPVPMLPGCFIAVGRRLFEEAGGFDDGILIWGNEAAELCLRTWCRGYECRLVPAVDVAHLFRPTFTYEYSSELALHNSLRLGVAHFKRERLARLVERVSKISGFAAAMARVLDSDASERRARIQAERQRDDDWFFDRFDIEVLG